MGIYPAHDQSGVGRRKVPRTWRTGCRTADIRARGRNDPNSSRAPRPTTLAYGARSRSRLPST
eukprot:6784945-Pyramimonas_sp.AAC.3